ncbi:tryptophan-rich sensory protein [Alistipes timonensis]|uniref:tryptophan-rich sensory protein n=1 Tax=Alistipes timonensis TaxID=1465754 RepID=UPI00311935C9
MPTLHCFLAGGLVGWLQNDSSREWYPTLVQPALTPPDAVFWLFSLSLRKTALMLIFICLHCCANKFNQPI